MQIFWQKNDPEWNFWKRTKVWKGTRISFLEMDKGWKGAGYNLWKWTKVGRELADAKIFGKFILHYAILAGKETLIRIVRNRR